MRPPIPATSADAFSLGEFLGSMGLSTDGLDAETTRLWMDLDPDGRIVATSGLELTGQEALLRSVAVAPALRRSGRGTELARFALDQAAGTGATRAWLMSRRSPNLWPALGFQPADIHQLAAALLPTAQVQAFARSGQLDYETAWVMSLR